MRKESAAARVRAAILTIGQGIVFTTGDLLVHGSRTAIDSILWRLVKAGLIKRLSRGVFIVPALEQELPVVSVIAQAKAKRFNKKLSAPDGNLESCGNVFGSNGCYTSFDSARGRVFFKSVSPRKLGAMSAGKAEDIASEQNLAAESNTEGAEARLHLFRMAMRLLRLLFKVFDKEQLESVLSLAESVA